MHIKFLRYVRDEEGSVPMTLPLIITYSAVMPLLQPQLPPRMLHTPLRS